jgi:hypothetical protein
MESKLNHSSIEAYSTAYTQKIASDFYRSNESITGNQIVELCNIRQINFLILKNLFQKWKKETEKLQSPYFDYNDQKVKEALQSFMNVLSQNISVKRNHFEPVLKKAVHETILLIFAPFEYFGREINNPERTKISLEDLQEISRYVKVNTYPLEALVDKFKNQNVNEMYNDEAYSSLNDISLEKKDNKKENFQESLDQFSQTLPLSLDIIFEIAEEKKVEEEIKNILVDKEVPEVKEKSSPTNFFNQHLTLNEKLNNKSKATIADLHQKKKIENIKKHISIYQRFMFINELFNGKVDEFDKAVETLDVCNNYQEALHVIDKNYMKQYKWNMEAEEVNEFLEILAKRYN